MPLIVSTRHTRADLAHWARLARRDNLLARAPELDRLVDQATAAMRDFAAAGPCLLGTSWGKDSVVVAHLAWSAGLDVPVMRMVQDRPDRRENPDIPAVRDAFLNRFPCSYTEFMSSADDGLAHMNAANGGRYISGVRADESSTRSLTVAKNGLASASTCRPIGWWRAMHVWAYLARHDLPIHPAYAMTHGGVLNRDRIRVHSIGGTEQGSGVGRLQWERHYYKEVWHDLDKAASQQA